MARDRLDAILVLGTPEEYLADKRVARAVAESERRPYGVFIVSGGKTPSLPEQYESEADMMFQKLVDAGIDAERIVKKKGAEDTVDNLLESLVGKRYDAVGVVSSPSQTRRIRDIGYRAKREGLLDRDLRLEEIRTDETMMERAYNALAAAVIDRFGLRNGIMESRKNSSEIAGNNSKMKRFANWGLIKANDYAGRMKQWIKRDK